MNAQSNEYYIETLENALHELTRLCTRLSKSIDGGPYQVYGQIYIHRRPDIAGAMEAEGVGRVIEVLGVPHSREIREWTEGRYVSSEVTVFTQNCDEE